MKFNLLSGWKSSPDPAVQWPACTVPAGSGFAKLLAAEAPEALAEPASPDAAVWVNATPELAVRRGSPDPAALRLDLWTDFGPPDEDKLCNQDAALYVPLGPPWPGLVVALADGVSNSPYSEFGARLAVAVATSEIASRLNRCSGPQLPDPAWFQAAFEHTVALIRQRLFGLRLRLSSSPGEFLPVGWHPRAFLPAVRDKKVLLTTLLVAVIVEGPEGESWGFYSHVGDGALAFCRGPLPPSGPLDVVNVLVCQPDTAIESFLGPDVERACFPRCFYSRLGREFVVCLSTDGVARAVPAEQLLQRWHQGSADVSENVARTLIESLKTEIPEAVADNLSLAFVSRLSRSGFLA
jgi:hypothetical protein